MSFSRSNRPLCTADVECYFDYFLICFREINGDRRVYLEMFDGQPLDRSKLIKILSRFTIITFNGNTYDVPMIRLALKPGVTNLMLKRMSDEIVVRQKRIWELEDKYNLPKLGMLDHIDIIEPMPSVQVGLKLYGARLHSRFLQDLPLEPSARIFDFEPTVRRTMVSYCFNDNEVTEDCYRHIEKQIELRTEMSCRYGIDLRSKSDAQIAEAVLRHELERIKGEKLYRPEFPIGYTFKYEVPDFIEFKTQQMRDVLNTVQSAVFSLKKKEVRDDDDDSDGLEGGIKIKISGIEMPKEIKSLRIKIGSSTYKMGIGGLHSTEKKVTHESDSEYVLIDNDVASYYPAIMLICGLYPEHLGDDFLNIYRDIRNERVRAKRIKDKVTDMTLKIVLNGTFGKLGSKWSILYAPNLMIQVTITGQLALLMLIESLELAGISVISANTDGIVSKCPRNKVDLMYSIIAAWEKKTGFDMEQAIYESLHSASVNSYIAVKASYQAEKKVFDSFPFLRNEVRSGAVFKRGVKQKGLFAFVGSKGSPAEKNPATYICIDAVVNYIVDGTPLEDTIEWCTDIRRFITVRRVKGGALYGGEYLGKVVRWYYSRNGHEPIRYAENGNKVAKSDGAMPIMELGGDFPNDIDWDFYRSESIKMLANLGVL